MQPVPVFTLPTMPRTRTRSALVTSADRSFRQRLGEILTGLRWQVREASSGAQAWAEAEATAPEAIVVDSWLPDLDLAEFLKDFRRYFPGVDLVTTGAASAEESPRGPYRQELLYALRRSQETDTAAWNTAPSLTKPEPTRTPVAGARVQPAGPDAADAAGAGRHGLALAVPATEEVALPTRTPVICERLPELVGNAACMLEVSRRVRLVAPRSTPVLIEGPTGSGKELVA